MLKFRMSVFSPRTPVTESIVFIDEVEGIKRRITDEAEGRVCNPTLDPDTEAINDI